MEERNYQVQEAVRLIGVESHVLRYWEEELGISVGRTKQGYRLYSEENIRLFLQIKELKAQGIGLKAIRLLLGSADDDGITGRERLMASLAQAGTAVQKMPEQERSEREIPENARPETMQSEMKEKPEQEPQEKTEVHLEYEVITDEADTMDKFEKVLKRIIREAVADQNEKLELAVTELFREELELQLEAILDAMQEAAVQQEKEDGLWKRIWRHFGRK